MSSTFAGKKIVITGGVGRIGSAAAAAFMQDGGQILLVDQNEQKLLTLRERLEENYHNECHIFPYTSDNPQILDSLIKKITILFGRVDILINCPGYIYRSPFIDHSLDELDELWQYNVKTVFIISQAISRLMIAQGAGKIINFASVGGTRPELYHAGYCAAKAAVIAFSKVAALELAPNNIQVNVVAPGPTETMPFTSPYYLEHPEVLQQIETNTPAGRIGHPQDHLGLLLFLASDSSNWITGQVIMSDGGLGLT